MGNLYNLNIVFNVSAADSKEVRSFGKMPEFMSHMTVFLLAIDILLAALEFLIVFAVTGT